MHALGDELLFHHFQWDLITPIQRCLNPDRRSHSCSWANQGVDVLRLGCGGLSLEGGLAAPARIERKAHLILQLAQRTAGKVTAPSVLFIAEGDRAPVEVPITLAADAIVAKEWRGGLQRHPDGGCFSGMPPPPKNAKLLCQGLKSLPGKLGPRATG